MSSESEMDIRTFERTIALAEMKTEIIRLNGTDENCRCLRRQKAYSWCDKCGEYTYNGYCINKSCDKYYTSTIVKCDKWCGKWMLSVYTKE
jgi:hypothetical protein